MVQNLLSLQVNKVTMAREITVIQQEILDAISGDATLSAQLTSTSKTALFRLYSYLSAVAVWSVEKLMDIFKTETDEKIATLKPHSLRWYALKAAAFQYGYSLVDDADYYDNTGIPDATIEASKIVSFAAVVEATRGLRIKVAKTSGGNLAALSGGELTSFSVYMGRVKDAGVKLDITSGSADSLKQTIDIYYDPLVINSSGARIDGTSSDPVGDAIRSYLKNLPFNGVFAVQKEVDYLQTVEGVVLINVKSSKAKYAALPYTSFSVQYIPDAGYLRIVSPGDLILSFIPYSN